MIIQIKLLKQNVLRLVAFAVMGFSISGTAWADPTYGLIRVYSITSNNLYVFEQDGHVMKKLPDSGTTIPTTTNYLTSGLNGKEGYVWRLTKYGTNSKGFKIMNQVSGKYLSNTNSTDIIEETTSSEWLFKFQNDSTVLIQNKSYENRFLGFTDATSYAYKAYTTGYLNDKAHAIKVYQLIENIVPVAIPSSTGYATFSSQYPLDFTNISSIKAYIATDDGTTGGVNFRRVNKVPANTGVLLVSTSGRAVEAIAVPYLTGDADNVDGNVFVAVSAATNVPSTDTDVANYILFKGSKGIGFYEANGQKVGAGKAYISVRTGLGVKGFIDLPNSGDETGLRERANDKTVNDKRYNLAGQQMNRVQKGIFIVNGQKMVK